MDWILTAIIELHYQVHFQNPENRLTNLRGFDNRSRTFAIENAVLDAKGTHGPIGVHVALQIGDTPTTYYGAEQDWKYLQVATLSGTTHATTIEAGLFPSPIGIEVIPIKDNMSWSRSNLFFGLPFYHVGATVSHPLGNWTGKLHVYNGWNNVVDNNASPSVAASAAYAKGSTTAQVMYFGGIERNAWRSLFDAYAQHAITDELTLAAHADGGFESKSWWLAGAGYAKYTVTPKLYAAVRADYFYEHVSDGVAPIFWPVEYVASGTATVAYQPAPTISLRLEYRHDHAAGDVYFGGDIEVDPTTMVAIPDRATQDTLTAGVTAWF